MVIALIVDIVGSRRLADRDSAQRALDATIEEVHTAHPLALEPLRPVVGDEEQGVFPTLEAALATTLLMQLGLPAWLECRYGVGVGDVRTIESAGRKISEGPGWWAAREAIDIVHDRERRPPYTARTWCVGSPEQNAAMESTVRMVNAAAAVRDQLLAGLSDRQRRLAYGRCLGKTQHDLADEEGIGQSAVSQTLRTSGAAALVESFHILTAGGAP